MLEPRQRVRVALTWAAAGSAAAAAVAPASAGWAAATYQSTVESSHV
jgi:hypothetical protein